LNEKSGVGSYILYPKIQEVELAKLSLLNLWKQDFLEIDPFHYPYSYTREVNPNEEVDALRCYGAKELAFQEFPIRQTTASNSKKFILEHRLTIRKVYHFSGLEPDAKPHADAIHHEIGRCY